MLGSYFFLKSSEKQLLFYINCDIINRLFAEMAERLNAHDSKSCDAGMYPRVQIPLSAPKKSYRNDATFFV